MGAATNSLSPMKVAEEFTRIYYGVTAQMPNELRKLYGESSVLDHGAPHLCATGIDDIAKIAHNLPLSTHLASLDSVVGQPFSGKPEDGNVLIVATGHFGPSKTPFSQTFVLAKQPLSNDGHFYCSNDIFSILSDGTNKNTSNNSNSTSVDNMNKSSVTDKKDEIKKAVALNDNTSDSKQQENSIPQNQQYATHSHVNHQLTQSNHQHQRQRVNNTGTSSSQQQHQQQQHQQQLSSPTTNTTTAANKSTNSSNNVPVPSTTRRTTEIGATDNAANTNATSNISPAVLNRSAASTMTNAKSVDLLETSTNTTANTSKLTKTSPTTVSADSTRTTGPNALLSSSEGVQQKTIPQIDSNVSHVGKTSIPDERQSQSVNVKTSNNSSSNSNDEKVNSSSSSSSAKKTWASIVSSKDDPNNVLLPNGNLIQSSGSGGSVGIGNTGVSNSSGNATSNTVSSSASVSVSVAGNVAVTNSNAPTSMAGSPVTNGSDLMKTADTVASNNNVKSGEMKDRSSLEKGSKNNSGNDGSGYHHNSHNHHHNHYHHHINGGGSGRYGMNNGFRGGNGNYHHSNNNNGVGGGRNFGPSAVVTLSSTGMSLTDTKSISIKLREEFSQYGHKLRGVEVKATKGIAFIEYDSVEGVKAAVEAWAHGPRQEGVFKGIALHVSEKRPPVPYANRRGGMMRGGGRGGARGGSGIRRGRPPMTSSSPMV